jgi:transcriptional regulator with XRE-family HTH domain
MSQSQTVMTTWERRGAAAPTTASDLAGRLRDARKARGLSMRQLALTLGVSPALIGQWETSVCRPSPDDRLNLSVILGVPLRDIFSDLLPRAQERGPWLIDDQEAMDLVNLYRRLSGKYREALLTVATSLAAQMAPEAADETASSDATAPADSSENTHSR